MARNAHDMLIDFHAAIHDEPHPEAVRRRCAGAAGGAA